MVTKKLNKLPLALSITLMFSNFNLEAQSTWIGGGTNPVEMQLPANWNPAVKPNDVVTIYNGSASNFTPQLIAGGGPMNLSELDFTSTNQYIFAINDVLTINANGIVIETGPAPIFNVGTNGDITFRNSSTASSAVFNNNETIAFGAPRGSDTCTAGSSTINTTTFETLFLGNTTAGSSTQNVSGTGQLLFRDNSSMGTSTINVDGPSAALVLSAGITGEAAINATNSAQISLAGGNVTFGSLSSDSTALVLVSSLTNLTIGGNNFSTTFGGSINTPSSIFLTKVGTGTLDITNDIGSGLTGITVTGGILQFDGNNSDFTGAAAVNGGNLKVNGALGGTVSVNSGGFLSGTGTLNDIIINSGGTMAPGNSIGTILVSGNYVQNSDSFYNVQIDEAGDSTLTNVTGTATLNGGLVQVTEIGSVVTPQQYMILHAAGGVNGTFSGVTFASAVLMPSLIYDLNDVFLLLTISKTPFTPLVATSNQAAVALQLENLYHDTPDPAQVAFLDTIIPLSLPELQNVFDKLSGVQYTSILEVGRLANRRFLRGLYDPLRYDLAYGNCDCECEKNNAQIWTNFEGGRAFFEGNENAKGFSDYNYDASIGAQTYLCDELILGVAAGYEYDHLKYDLAGHGRVHTAQGALYAAFTQSEFYLFSDLVGGWSDFKVVRPIQYSTNDLTAFGNTHLYHATIYTEGGLNLDWSCLLIQPFVGIDVSYYRFNNIQERGTDVVDLNIRGKSIVDTDSYLGMHFLTSLQQDLILSTDLAWVHRFYNRDHLIDVQFQGFGDEFSILGINDGRNGFEGAITIARTFCDSFTLYAEFSGEVWSHLTNYEGTLGLLAEW